MSETKARAERESFEARLAEVLARPLLKGQHDPGSEMCVMEAAAYIAGEPWSDSPHCVCPTITAFMVSWNDALPTDAERDRLLKPLLPKLIGTRSTDALAERRAWMAFDWLVRVHTPRWLDLTESLKPHAAALRRLPEIVDLAGALAAGESLKAAQQAAAAAWAAAWDAARDAAWAAARDAAWDAAWDAARAAALDAARAAARDAAWAAARDALKPTTEWLQASAQQLVIRMCELTPVSQQNTGANP